MENDIGASNAAGAGGGSSSPGSTGAAAGTASSTSGGDSPAPPEQPSCYDGAPLVCSQDEPADTFVAPSSPSLQLQLVTVYEAHSHHGGGCNPIGGFSVHVARPGSHVLVLSSYEPVHWVVTADPGAAVQRVVLRGYSDASAEVPAGALLEEHTYEGTDEDSGPTPYEWPSAEGDALASISEQQTGAELTTVHAAYCLNDVVIE